MCEKNVIFLSQPFQAFEKASIKSKLFDPKLSMVASDSNGAIVAFFMVVLRKSLVRRKKRKVASLKFMVVEQNWRYIGLGSKIFSLLENKIRNSEKKSLRMKFEVIVSPPDYWSPGLDPRHTEAFFFLKKQGFKKKSERINLCVDLELVPNEMPPSDFKEFNISRAKPEDKEDLVPLKFMPFQYRYSFWPSEIAISLQDDPIGTFIARRKDTGEIIGWASHSIHFPGSFGPTGVKKSERGKGLGGVLLRWCLWDLKQMGINSAKILWVGTDTAYFYLKSTGAHICEIYWTMHKRI